MHATGILRITTIGLPVSSYKIGYKGHRVYSGWAETLNQS